MTFLGLRQYVNEEFKLNNLDFDIVIRTNSINIEREREDNLQIY